MNVIATLALGALLVLPSLSNRDKDEEKIDIVPPEFQRRRSRDDLALSPTRVVQQPLQALHNDYFNSFRPFSASVHFRPERDLIDQNEYPIGSTGENGDQLDPYANRSSEMDGKMLDKYPRTTIILDQADLMREQAVEIEGHVFTDPTGYLRRHPKSDKWINALRAAAEVHLRWLPDQRSNEARISTPSSSSSESVEIALTEPVKNAIGNESRSFVQASLSTAGAGVIGVKSAITLPDTNFSVFGSWPLFVGKSNGPSLKNLSSPQSSPSATSPTSVGGDNSEALERAHRAAVHDIEASQALHSRDQRAVPFSGSSSHGMIDERKLGARYDGDNFLVGGFIQACGEDDGLIPIYSGEHKNERVPNLNSPPLLEACTPFFTSLFNAGPNKNESELKQPTLGGWFGIRNNRVVAVVDGTLDFEREASDLNLSLRYRDQLRHKYKTEFVHHRSGASAAPAESYPKDPQNLSWGEWLFTSSEELNRMEMEYIAAMRGSINHGIPRQTGGNDTNITFNPAEMRRTPSFELGFDVRRWGSEALFSFSQRIITRRKVLNVFEESNVVGIHNPVDIGIQLGFGTHAPVENTPVQIASTPIEDESPLKHFTSMSMVGSWQVNKNMLLKGRIQDTGIAGALVLKTWTEPTGTLAASVHKGFLGEPMKFGLRLQSENYGDVEHHAASATRVTHHANRFVLTPEQKAQRYQSM